MGNYSWERFRSSLRLDSRNGWIAGVCAGIARYFNTDPAFVRVGVVVSALFFAKFVIAAYLIAWLIFDEAPRD